MQGDFLQLTLLPVKAESYEHERFLPFAASGLCSSDIIEHRCLTRGDDVKTVYEIKLDLKNIDYKYQVGDAIGIFPVNDPSEVELILKRLGIIGIADQHYKLELSEHPIQKKPVIPPHLPITGKLRSLFDKYLDLRSPPKKKFLRALCKHVNDRNEYESLMALSDPKSKSYSDFIEKDGATLLGLLRAFPTCNPTVTCLLEHTPALKPRYYSIASSPHENHLTVAFSVLETKGVCTGYLERTLTGGRVQFYFRQSNDFLDVKSPVILVGPGTGVAPFVGFLEHNRIEKKRIDTVLYFGCRYNDRDFLFKDKLNEFLSDGVLNELHLAFSREQTEKVYVQDKIRANGEKFTRAVLYDKATVCVCGDGKVMAKNVEDALKYCLEHYGGMDSEEAGTYVTEMRKTGRFKLDIWI